jgi:hypothetical protein
VNTLEEYLASLTQTEENVKRRDYHKRDYNSKGAYNKDYKPMKPRYTYKDLDDIDNNRVEIKEKAKPEQKKNINTSRALVSYDDL